MHAPHKHIYTTTVAIRWSDLDEYGHVNHAAYWDYFQEARLKWLNEIELHQPSEHLYPIVEAHIHYRRALTYPGTALIKLQSEQPSKKFWILHHELYREDNPTLLCATAWIRSVCTERQSQKIISLPEAFKEALYKSE